MKPPDPPIIPEKDFEILPQLVKDYYVVLRANGEM